MRENVRRDRKARFGTEFLTACWAVFPAILRIWHWHYFTDCIAVYDERNLFGWRICHVWLLLCVSGISAGCNWKSGKKKETDERIAGSPLDFCFKRQIVQALSGKKTDMIFRSVQAVERKCSMRRKKES